MGSSVLINADWYYNATNDHIGLDDVRFHSAAIAEPGTLAILGVAGLGFARRRKAA